MSPPTALAILAIMSVPPAVWVALGFLIAGALIWKSKLLPREIADPIDLWSAIAVALFVGFAVITLPGLFK